MGALSQHDMTEEAAVFDAAVAIGQMQDIGIEKRIIANAVDGS